MNVQESLRPNLPFSMSLMIRLTLNESSRQFEVDWQALASDCFEFEISNTENNLWISKASNAENTFDVLRRTEKFKCERVEKIERTADGWRRSDRYLVGCQHTATVSLERQIQKHTLNMHQISRLMQCCSSSTLLEPIVCLPKWESKPILLESSQLAIYSSPANRISFELFWKAWLRLIGDTPGEAHLKALR